MISSKGNSKRGRPKKKIDEDDESSGEYTKKKPSKKSQKAATTAKKAAETEKKQRKKAQVKSKVEISQSSESEESESPQKIEENVPKIVTIPLEMFMPDKFFAEILNRANKEPDFLINLRNLLSGCSRILRDKKSFLNKKWQILRNSNCTQDEYLSREAELKRIEVEEIYEIEKDIMSKLSYANIKGFELKQNLINDYKHSLIDLVTKASKIEPDTEYLIEEQTWSKYHQLQKKLLSLLMNQKDLVSQKTMQPVRNNQGLPHMREKMVSEQNQMDHKINTIQTEENPQATQFLFCKHFSQINYDKVFQNHNNPFKLHENDIYYMDPKALSWILELKSDQIYTNEKFHKETYKRYTDMLDSIYKNSKDMKDETLIEQLLEIAAYILNMVHYYQKFKLKCDLLHPLDLLLVIEKIKKDRKSKQNATSINEQTFQKEMEGISEAIKEVAQPMKAQ